MKRANSYDTGVASEYYVLSLLYRKGFEAYATLGNKKSVDIRVVSNEQTLSIDVKAVQGYSSLIVNNVKDKINHFVIFLIYNNKFKDVTTIPDLYVVPSSHIKHIAKSYQDQKRVFKRDLDKYKNRWDYLFKDYEAINTAGNRKSDTVCESAIVEVAV